MDQLTHELNNSVKLQVSAATQIGPYHVQAGVPNQDAYDFIPSNGFLTLAVADGAGSLERSDEGSELAVEVAAGMAADLMLDAQRAGTTPDLQKVVAESLLEARTIAFTLDYWQQAGSTLVLAVLSESDFAVAVLGDSFAVVQDRTGDLSLVQPPSAGEFANVTKLLTSEDATVSMCWGKLSELKGLALCSDAFEQSTLEQRVPTSGFWSRVFSLSAQGKLNAQELISFMDQQGKIEDDATLIALSVTSSKSEAATREDSEMESAEANKNSTAEIFQQDYSLVELQELFAPDSTLTMPADAERMRARAQSANIVPVEDSATAPATRLKGARGIPTQI